MPDMVTPTAALSVQCLATTLQSSAGGGPRIGRKCALFLLRTQRDAARNPLSQDPRQELSFVCSETLFLSYMPLVP